MTPTHWTKRDGTQVAIVEMTDDHLRNTIAMLDRVTERDAGAADEALAYARSTSAEMASYYAGGEADELYRRASAALAWRIVLFEEQKRRFRSAAKALEQGPNLELERA